MKQHCLIVCYSYTGNTHRIAEALRRLTGGELADIWPRYPYPMSFAPLLKQAQKEVSTGCWPCLLPISVDPTDYDVIFVGSPNWCGTVAPPMAAFLAKYKLDGKVIAPFYSHCGGGTGDLQRDVQSLCPAAGVQPILAVTGDGGETLDQTLRGWLRALAPACLAES